MGKPGKTSAELEALLELNHGREERRTDNYRNDPNSRTLYYMRRAQSDTRRVERRLAEARKREESYRDGLA